MEEGIGLCNKASRCSGGIDIASSPVELGMYDIAGLAFLLMATTLLVLVPLSGIAALAASVDKLKDIWSHRHVWRAPARASVPQVLRRTPVYRR